MRYFESKFNIWSQLGEIEVIFVTTNLGNNSSGKAVMGKGIAYEAATRFPEIPSILGNLNRARCIHPSKLWENNGTEIWSFPTKPLAFTMKDIRERAKIISYMADRYHPGSIVPSWAQRSSLSLIESSLIKAAALPHRSFALPLPGCGNGQLDPTLVETLLDKYLDHRFTIHSR